MRYSPYQKLRLKYVVFPPMEQPETNFSEVTFIGIVMPKQLPLIKKRNGALKIVEWCNLDDEVFNDRN